MSKKPSKGKPPKGQPAKGGRKQRIQFEARIIAKAHRDPRFKAALLRNPKEAIEAEFGVDLGDDLQLTVVQESFYSRYLVLPEPLEEIADGEELTDEDLATVAARAGCINFINRPEIGM